MPGASRIGDICSGHGPWPPRPIVSGSGDVLINGIGAARLSDALPSHCSPAGCHPGTVAVGSSTVFVNGLPLARIGDAVDCGSTIASGSGDVIAN